jgi:hypothetical protein
VFTTMGTVLWCTMMPWAKLASLLVVSLVCGIECCLPTHVILINQWTPFKSKVVELNGGVGFLSSRSAAQTRHHLYVQDEQLLDLTEPLD